MKTNAGVRWHYVVLVFAGLLAALYFLRQVYPGCALECYTLHEQIIAGDAGSPYRYRILSPMLAETLMPLIPGAPIIANAAAYTLLHAIMFPLMFAALYHWLRVWLTADRALIGVLVFAVLLPLGMYVYFLSAYSVLEVILFSVGLLMLIRPRFNPVAFGVLVVLATLNRETAFVLPVALFAVTRNWRMALGMGALWLITYAALWLTFGSAEHIVTLPYLWQQNTGEYLAYALLHNAFMLPLWIGAALNYRRAHPVLQRLLIVAAVYMPFALVWGQWYEVRLQWLMLPLLLPLALEGGAYVGRGLSVHVGGDHRVMSDRDSSGDRDTARSGRAGDADLQRVEERK